MKGVCAKNLKATLLWIDFVKAFNSIHGEKMEQILIAHGLPKETVTAIMMLNKKCKKMVCSSDIDTDFFDIVAGRNILALYLFIIYLEYIQ